MSASRPRPFDQPAKTQIDERLLARASRSELGRMALNARRLRETLAGLNEKLRSAETVFADKVMARRLADEIRTFTAERERLIETAATLPSTTVEDAFYKLAIWRTTVCPGERALAPEDALARTAFDEMLSIIGQSKP